MTTTWGEKNPKYVGTRTSSAEADIKIQVLSNMIKVPDVDGKLLSKHLNNVITWPMGGFHHVDTPPTQLGSYQSVEVQLLH